MEYIPNLFYLIPNQLNNFFNKMVKALKIFFFFQLCCLFFVVVSQDPENEIERKVKQKKRKRR